MTETFLGYYRKNEQVGIRNYVAILAAMDNVNPIAQRITELVKGTVLITDLFGRKQAGANHIARMKALCESACNPNVGAVLVISLHKPSALQLAEQIDAADQQVEYITYQNYASSLKTIEAGAAIALKMGTFFIFSVYRFGGW